MPLNKSEEFEFDKENDIEKRRPKPFRYLKSDESFDEDLKEFDEDNTFSLMKTSKSKMKLNYENPIVLSNNKNIGKVEEILKKHEEIRKMKDF
jgi:hypothetical protein